MLKETLDSAIALGLLHVLEESNACRRVSATCEA
jgi:hypothetical protein